MVQPTSQTGTIPAARAGVTLTAAIPAGSGESAVNAGSGSAAGAVLPAPAITKQLAASINPGSASPQTAATASPAPTLLAVIPSGALTYKIQGSRFESIAAETLDNAGTSEDGFDDMMAPVVSALGEDEPALSSLQGDVTDADFTPGEFSATVHAPISADINSFIAIGDSQVSTPADAATPTAPPPPAATHTDDSPVYGYGGQRGGDSPRFQGILPPGEEPGDEDTTPVIM